MDSTYCRSCPPDAKSCGAKNADGLWCTREHGHPPPHVACSEKHEVATWGAPIDPVLVTLAAAFIAARLPHEPSEDAIRHGISDALATLAELKRHGPLLAAAPEMIAALEAAAPHHQGGHSEVGRMIRVALAKAKGGGT